MWGALMVGAVFTAFNPVRIAVVALLISRPRPLANLFAYWIGALVIGIPTLLVPLMVLHSSQEVTSLTQSLATSSIFKHVQVGLGVCVLIAAAWLAVRLLTRQRARLSASGGESMTLVLDPSPPDPVSKFLGGRPTEAEGPRSPVRRLLGRAHNAWENESLWVAGLLGGLMGGPSLDGVILGMAVIVTSGAAFGTQVVAAVASVFVMLIVVELILLSSVVAPARTRSILKVVHDAVQTHRQQILIVLFSVVGVVLVAQGLGLF